MSGICHSENQQYVRALGCFLPMSDNVIDISESSVDSSDVTPNSRGSFNNEHTVESDPSTAEVEVTIAM